MIARPEVQDILKKFVVAEIYTDRDPRRKDVDADANGRIQVQRFRTAALPLYVILGPDGKERARLLGKTSVAEFTAFLKKGLEEPLFNGGSK